ncbi:heme-binding domain-containing protein [Algoriphagus aestuariicola]|jgi:hypothetical protein|uniref:Heme-binding domain-containing protein n=1 Tax=Algoriphagus aestuariicola TaxID=1852016 RepID=A0ABS3BJH1_9BACT|nr:heme-binding domain-containing protein [Algoriphagus aestuariicola]MBN7799427.1 heme-binding domain-containing protein [Algoriphagus aestuariicola]
MTRWQWVLGGTAILLLAIQLVPNELPAVESNNPGDLIQSGVVGEDVAVLLKNACYDCHSNESKYPWYSNVAPASWLVAKDVREAREELNFSLWQDYDMMDQLGKLDDIYLEVDEGKMPLGIYTLMHPSAKLDETQRKTIVEWAEATMDVIAEEEEDEPVEIE